MPITYSMQEKQGIIKCYRNKYKELEKKKDKSNIITELCQTIGFTRKHCIEVLNGRHCLVNRRKGSGRPKKYSEELIDPVYNLWIQSNKICEERFKVFLPEILKYSNISEKQKSLILSMSTFTLNKFLKRAKLKHGFSRLGLSGTVSSPLKDSVVIRTDNNDVLKAGYIEMDSVHHCGNSLTGQYAITVQAVDIHTHWSELFIKLTSGSLTSISALHDFNKRFPFKIINIDSDNGSEFLNYSFLDNLKKYDIQYSRSRPYHKNDQAHIEGMNYHNVRRNLGYGRITDKYIVDAILDLYRNELSILHNFFYPTIKSKTVYLGNGKSKRIRIDCKSPFQRILDDSSIHQAQKDLLINKKNSFDFLLISNSFNAKLSKINNLIYRPKI